MNAHTNFSFYWVRSIWIFFIHLLTFIYYTKLSGAFILMLISCSKGNFSLRVSWFKLLIYMIFFFGVWFLRETCKSNLDHMERGSSPTNRSKFLCNLHEKYECCLGYIKSLKIELKSLEGHFALVGLRIKICSVRFLRYYGSSVLGKF